MVNHDMRRRKICGLFLAGLLVLLLAEPAMAWGPLTHVRLAGDLLSQLWLLPAGIAALLARHGRYFAFGNIAADVVFAKKLSRLKQVCHHWTTGFSLLEAARTDEGRAFGYGYLAHLAADTVAHNKFLPRQMALSGSTISFGHVYWEVRADAAIPSDSWHTLRSLLHHRYEEPERLLAERLTATLLPFGMNRRIFRRMNLLACARSWQRSVAVWSALSRWPLDEETLADYHAEALERILDVLERGRASPVLHADPNGNAALSYAKAQRRQFRQLRRANLPVAHVVAEAALNHAPQRAHAKPVAMPRAS